MSSVVWGGILERPLLQGVRRLGLKGRREGFTVGGKMVKACRGRRRTSEQKGKGKFSTLKVGGGRTRKKKARKQIETEEGRLHRKEGC